MKIQPESLCMGCMEAVNNRECPVCGWIENAEAASPFYLRPRTILDRRYLLGRVLGAGGFGITYLGWDLNLGVKLAIKEYFPSAFGARNSDHTTVVPSTAQSRSMFEHGLSRFLDEGRALARFQGHPCIASVLTFFNENGTSYLVMRYEDGITFQQYLSDRGGRIEYQHAINLAMPVMDALRAVHDAGILHRDISPDNIYINRAGQIKILDFGSAKHDLASQNQSTQITMKRGYSPEEQYRRNGKVGPWTDVYALGATVYHAITGEVPPESLDRLEEDSLQPPSKLGIQLPKKAEDAIMRSLAVRAVNRFQTMKEFQDAIAGVPAVPEPPPRTIHTVPAQPGRAIPRKAWVAIAVGILCLLAILWLASPPPRIIEFGAEQANIHRGESATLRWSADAGSIAIEPGIGQVPENSGTRTISPSQTTTYTLTARRFLKSAERSVVVVVLALPSPQGTPVSEAKPRPLVRTEPVPKEPVSPKPNPPQITSFTANPSTISPGQSSTLTWAVSGEVRKLTIEDIGPVDPDASQQVSPQQTKTYTLMVNGPAGSDRRSVTVTVTTPSAPADPGTLHLEIFDEKHQPMAALIEIEGSGSNASLHTLTPTHSGVQDGSLPAGTYKVTVTAPGYAAATTSTTIESGARMAIRVNMAPK
jgi:serine/threonine protein kinase